MPRPSAYRGGNTALWGDPCCTRALAGGWGFIKREGWGSQWPGDTCRHVTLLVLTTPITSLEAQSMLLFTTTWGGSSLHLASVPFQNNSISDKWMNSRAKIEFKWSRQAQLGLVYGLHTHLCSHVGLLLLLLTDVGVVVRPRQIQASRPGQCFKLDSTAALTDQLSWM